MPAPQAHSYTRALLAAWCIGLSSVAALPALPGPGAIFCCFAVAATLARRGALTPLLATGVLLGVGWAGLQGQERLARQLPEDCLRAPLVVTGVIATLPRHTPAAGDTPRQRFELAVAGISPAACAGPRRLLLSYYGNQTLQPGQGWRLHTRLRRPWGLANPGSFNIQAWYAESGIDALGSAQKAQRQPALDHPWRYAHQRLRQWLAGRVTEAGLSGHGSAVIRAITVADKSGIDRSLWEQLQAWGLNHLLVVSGLHVGMLAGAVLLLVRGLQRLSPRAGARPGSAVCLALLAATAYAALAGFSVATSRALLMLAAVFLAIGAGRRGRGANALLPALALLLLLNPLAVTGSGLWLSFAAVASLLWLSTWQRAGGGLRSALRAHLFLALVMLPLGAVFFGGASLASAPANLVAVPLFALWVVPLALLGTLLALLGSGGADLLWQWAAAPVDLWLALTDTLGRPYQSVVAKPLAIALAALAAGALALPLSGWYRAVALVLLLPLLLPDRVSDSPTRITVLDVGQGTAVVVRQAGRALLYDTGGGDPAGANMARSVVLPFLRAHGISSLNDLVISHGDLDHAAGLDSVREALPVARLWMGGTAALPGLARPCIAGQGWRWPDGPRFRFLSPGAQGIGSSNNASCVLLVETGRGRVLLAGDVAKDQELQLVRYWQQALAAEVLLVGHHGSDTSSSQAWLNHVGPDLAIHSTGYANRFGHPHGAVAARLAGQGIEQRTTWREGALELAFDERGMVDLQAYRERRKTWWK